MRRRLTILSALVALVLMIPALALSAEHKRIAGDELTAMMKSGSDLVIVDVREPWRYSKGHIPGAINIPYNNAHGRILKELAPKDRIVFVCHGGPMGDELARILTKNNYMSVYNLKGGMHRWRGELER